MLGFHLRKHFSLEDGNQVCSISSVGRRLKLKEKKDLTMYNMEHFPKVRKLVSNPTPATGVQQHSLFVGSQLYRLYN